MRNYVLPALLGIVCLAASCGGGDQGQGAPPEIPVFVTEARQVPVHQEFVGQVSGLKDIAIRARVEGYLEGIHFREGSRVKQGALLYTIESQQYEAEVAAMLSKLAEAKTMRAKAESDLRRIRPLAEQKAVSESDLDAAVAQYEAAEAGVEAAEANLAAARIRLGYTKIHSPITGIIGRTRAKVGDFVGRDPNPVILNTVSRIDTVLVQFFITELQYLQLARRNLGDTLTGEGLAERRSSRRLDLILADGSVYPHSGAIDFIDRGIDPTTGAILIQASFVNPDELLRPGQFARVRALAEVVEDGILVPQRCVSELQGRFSVFVVGEDGTVEPRSVETGPKIGDRWLISSGLGPGETVIYEGLQMVRPGMKIVPVVRDLDQAPEGRE